MNAVLSVIALLCAADSATPRQSPADEWPSASLALQTTVKAAGRYELEIAEERLIAALADVLPEPTRADDFNHADARVLLGEQVVGGYQLVAAPTSLVRDGRFAAEKTQSPWVGIKRADYSFGTEAALPGRVLWAQADKLQNVRVAQPMQLQLGHLYLVQYAAYSDVQVGDVAVQLVDPKRVLYAALSHSYKRPLHHQRRWQSYQYLARADVEAADLAVTTAMQGRVGVADVRVRPARWRLVVNLPRPGTHTLRLSYVPRMGHRLTAPPDRVADESRLPLARTQCGPVELVDPNPDGVLLHTAQGDAWTLPNQWTLRTDRLRLSKPARPAQRQTVAIGRGMDATVLLAIDAASLRPDSIRTSLPVGVSLLRLASIPVNHFGTLDKVAYRQLDPLVPAGDPLVPYDPGVPTVLAITFQHNGRSVPGTYDGDVELLSGPAANPQAVLRLPVRLQVLPLTMDPIRHCGTCIGNQNMISRIYGEPGKAGTSVVEYHGLDLKMLGRPGPSGQPLRRLSHDYIRKLLECHLEPFAPVVGAGPEYKIVPAPDGGVPRIGQWDFAEHDRFLAEWKSLGLRDVMVMHTNGDIVDRFTPRNNVTYSFRPPPKPDTPRWQQLGEEEYWRLLTGYLEAIAAHLAEKGWLDGAYIMVDESSVASYPTLRRFKQELLRQPHACRLRLLNTHYHTAQYTKRLSGGATGPLELEGVIDVFTPENNDHFNHWPEDDIWPADRGPRPLHWVYYVETHHLDLPYAGVSTELLPLKVRSLGAEGFLLWASFIWSIPFPVREGTPLGGGAWGPVTNPWQNANYAHGQGLLSFFYPPDPRGPTRQPDFKITPSWRLFLLRDGFQDLALWEILQRGADDAGKPVRVDPAVLRRLAEQLQATWINPTQWRASRPHHRAWRALLYQSAVEATSSPSPACRERQDGRGPG